MNEDITYEAILQRMLNRIPNNIDKRESSIIYSTLAPAAAEIAQVYMKHKDIENRTYADTSYDEDLTKRAAERGVIRKEATKAIRKGIFNIDVPIGSRFNGDDLNYIVVAKDALGDFRLQCETPGEKGNSYKGILIPIDYIEGLEKAEITDIIVPGEDIEDDESLRKRYFETLESESFGGNISDYKKKTNDLPGVGGTKVYPAWNGGGTVKLIIIDSNFNKPSSTLLNDVQTSIDPIGNQGKGVGIAPVGHIVTIAGVSEKLINIKSAITLQIGYTWIDVESKIKEAIIKYFSELNSTWSSSNSLVVRISQIETRILNIVGVLDIQNTLLNDKAENLVLGTDEIPVLGEVVKV